MTPLPFCLSSPHPFLLSSLLSPPDVAAGALCPPVALRLGVALLCRLFQVWDQVAVGVTILAEWLLGDDCLDTSSEEDVDVVSVMLRT